MDRKPCLIVLIVYGMTLIIEKVGKNEKYNFCCPGKKGGHEEASLGPVYKYL